MSDVSDTDNSLCTWNCTQRLEKNPEELEIGGIIENIQITALMRSTKIFGKVLETRGDFLLLRLQGKAPS